LRIYEVLVRVVRTFYQGERMDPGRHTVEWDTRDSGGRLTSAGVYFLRLETADAAETVKIVVVR
jgi:hypothetical protein